MDGWMIDAWMNGWLVVDRWIDGRRMDRLRDGGMDDGEMEG